MTRHERFDPPRPAYKVSDASKMLRVGKAWVVQKAAAGDIPGAYRTHGTSGHWRFDPDRFDRYVADLRAGRVREKRKAPEQKKRPVRGAKNVEMNDWMDEFRKAG